MPLTSDELESAYRRLEKPLYNYLFRWFWDRAVSEDLMHDTFERLWKRRDRIDSERVDALIWTTLLNLARSRYRQVQRWQKVPLPAWLKARENPETVALSDERDRQLRQAIGGISAAAREVLLLELYSGLGRAEIARMLDIPEGTLASRKHNAIQHLNRMLKEPPNVD